jgi:hypothetical protein
MEIVTGGHLQEEALIDVLEGVAAPSVRAHAAACAECGARLAGAASGLELARGAEVPEPSPLYWHSFRSQVGSRIEAEPVSRWKHVFASPWLAAAAAVVAASAVLIPRAIHTPAASSAPAAATVLPAWSPLPPADEDPGLELLAAVVPGTTGLGPLAECDGLGDCMAEAATLSEEDSARLTDALRRELGSQS